MCAQALQAVQPKREMRAVWIATVANIDWPSRRWLSTAEQQDEMLRLLDGLARNHVNAVVLQVRPTADALYLSPYEPWSHWLTGKQGERPEPYYDPLQFVIDEAHRRFMEVHVWLNPYRVTHGGGTGDLSEEHLFFQRKDLFVRYGNAWYFDPGLDETREYLNRVVRDVVERYDIDAIHMDDYFYPYKIQGEDFPDQATFEAHPRGFAPDRKDDWRRNNVNLIIAELQRTIKSVKPWVEFGISPFGVWRNRSADPQGSDTQAGVQNYDDLYADITHWVEQGWIDYNMPQIYWEIGHPAADYITLIKWWNRHAGKAHLYIGQDVARTMRAGDLTRKMYYERTLPNIGGNCFWPANEILWNNGGIADSLRRRYHRYPALIPAYTHQHDRAPKRVKKLRAEWTPDGYVLHWQAEQSPTNPELASYFVIYRFANNEEIDLDDPRHIVATTRECHYLLPYEDGQTPFRYVVTAVDRFHNESEGRTKKVKL